jgi:hypothetical protein
MYERAKDIFIPVTSILFSVVVAYLIAVNAIRRESQQGGLRLLELVRRYFINLMDTFDLDRMVIKEDALSKRFYVEELKAILAGLEGLLAHPYFCALTKRYPLVSMLILHCRNSRSGPPGISRCL